MPLITNPNPNSGGLPGFATTPNARDGIWIPVLSSNLHRIQYVGDQKELPRAPRNPLPSRLWIQFWRKVKGSEQKVPGPTYLYTGVPREIWQGLLAADSKGTYHHRFIKYRYKYTTI